MDSVGKDGASRSGLASFAALEDDDPPAPLFLAEVAAVLAEWPARNQVVRRALDHACAELLRLAQGAGRDAEV